jgi:hypothetical protein
MYHLVTQDWELIHHHLRLVFTIDALVGDQPSSGDHIRSHTVTWNSIVSIISSTVLGRGFLPIKRITFLAFFCC